MRNLMTAIYVTTALTVLTGIAYPLVVLGLAQAVFPYQARGSLIAGNGRLVGARLIGQNFSQPGYFHPRPSAAGDKGYDAANSSGSNLAPTNKVLLDTVKSRVAAVVEENPEISPSGIPVDMVTASGSGLDPEISPAGADLQIARVAKARAMSEDRVRQLVREHTRGRLFGIFGEPGVNVLELNLALDAAPGVANR